MNRSFHPGAIAKPSQRAHPTSAKHYLLFALASVQAVPGGEEHRYLCHVGAMGYLHSFCSITCNAAR